jgi:ATP-dependent Clp protease ATP-binding subunit ClpA
MGARPMARLIQDTIRAALADELLFGRLAHGGRVTIDLGEDDKVRLTFEDKVAEPVMP